MNPTSAASLNSVGSAAPIRPPELTAEPYDSSAQPPAPEADFAEFTKSELEQSIPARFEAQVGRHPDRLAVGSRTGDLTYHELNRAANRLARAILARRGSVQEPVALLLDHDAPAPVAVLAALKAGKLCAPLDPLSPPERLARILDESQSGLLVVDGRHAEVGSSLFGRDRCLNVDESDLSSLLDDDLGLSIAPRSPAVLTYTSGSSGRPKGSVRSHRSLLYSTMVLTNDARICPDDRFSLLPALSSGAWKVDMFGALLNGAAVFPFNAREEGLTTLVEWLGHRQITIYHSSATLYRGLVGVLGAEERLPHIRLISLGGERIMPSDVEAFRRLFSDRCRLAIRYSSSESGLICREYLGKDTASAEPAASVGRPVDGVELLLVDDRGDPVAPGRVGEIVVRSRYLADGYWRRPDLTAAAFQADPAGGDARRYRTGDLGRLRPDGRLEYHGRKDAQLSIRGYRVEATEVEGALVELPQVQQAVVGAYAPRPGDTDLVAYVVPARGTEPSPAELRAALAAKLPPYMVPSAFVVVDALPLTAQGKVDRHALPLPEAPRTRGTTLLLGEVERRLAELWARALGVEQVGRHDDLFELGGHSMTAANLLVAIETYFSVRLPATALVQAPTVERFAQLLMQEGPAAPGPLLVRLRAGAKRPLFCVHPGGNLAGFALLAGRLDPDRAFYALVPPEPSSDFLVEELAARYVREIRSVQPDGPYLLGGSCIGGWVALEVAQQLRRAGQDVRLVVIDASAPKPRRPGRRDLSPPVPASLDPIRAAKRRAKLRYRASPYPGRITLIHSAKSAADPKRCQRATRWSRVALGGVVRRVVPCDHQGLFRAPGLEHVAAQLRAFLAEADADRPAPNRVVRRIGSLGTALTAAVAHALGLPMGLFDAADEGTYHVRRVLRRHRRRLARHLAHRARRGWRRARRPARLLGRHVRKCRRYAGPRIRRLAAWAGAARRVLPGRSG